VVARVGASEGAGGVGLLCWRPEAGFRDGGGNGVRWHSVEAAERARA
jgi:hypothetical protein